MHTRQALRELGIAQSAISGTQKQQPQQLLQLDHLTKELYDRMTPVQRYLLEIEPPEQGHGILRQPKREHKGWWN